MKLTKRAFAAAALTFAALTTPAFSQGKTLKVVMHSDLKIVDPIWTTAYITRNHGYMIYDTLFAMDEAGEIKPQMVDKYTVTPDGLTYTFTLRDGLVWHDDKPVTAEDCVTSIKRWSAKDGLGLKIASILDSMTVKDDKTFEIKLKEKTGLLIFALGKPSSTVPFMMPKRIASTDPNTQISEFVGSGPFVFKTEEWKPGDKAVYTKFAKYKPRSEPASGLSGGKVVNFDRVEWLAITDTQQQTNALLNGEIDVLEQPTHDLLPLLKKDKNVELFDGNPLGNQYSFRFNTIHKPFDNPKIRKALWYAFNQKDFLDATIGDPEYYKVCKAMFICGTPLASEKGMEGLLESNFEKARQILKEEGYDGTPIVLMHSTDLAVLTNLAPVAKQLMEKAGFKVEMVSMDWQTLVGRRAKRDAPNAGGWHAFLTSWVSADILNPVMGAYFIATGDKGIFGWPNDPELEKLRDDFFKETDPSKAKAIAEAVQVRVADFPTHIHVGQWFLPLAWRKGISGMPKAPVTVFWGIKKA